MEQLSVTITSDFVCPWCYLGEVRLRKALRALDLDDQVFREWKPFELNPDMPPEGMQRKEYRARKFGWTLSLQMDAELVAQGREDGIHFNYQAITRTPNTRLAHRLTLFVQQCGPRLADAYVQRVFQAYFEQGRDIGQKRVLLDIIQELGEDPHEASLYIEAGIGELEVIAAEALATHQGVHGVPHFQIGEQTIKGAQRVEVFEAGLLAAQAADEPTYGYQ
jgi:predicted DsbA family dithiol-disulfide isomerase